MTNTADRWTSIDLPVLQALVRRFDEGADHVRARELAAELDLDPNVVRRSIRLHIADGRLIQPRNAGRLGDAAGEIVLDIEPAALRAVGAWPTDESALDRLITALEAIAEHTDDTDTRTNARKFADWLRGSANTVGLSVASAVITGQIPS